MKSLSILLVVAVFIAVPQSASAQLTTDQRVFDFQNLAALYAKRYAPYDWKKQALGFDLLDIKPWIDRVRASKNDLEFFEIEAEYVGKFQDTHSGFSMTSSFSATLGITVDIYDSKVLIDSINRLTLPAATYPFQIGDEVVSVDGVSAEDWIARLSLWRQYGNPASTRRLAAGKITVRSQSTFPRAPEIGNTANIEIRRASGVLERYTIPWTKSGVPVTTAGPVPFAKPLSSPDTVPKNVQDALDELHNYRLPDNDEILKTIPWATDADGAPRRFVNGIGARAPIFVAGFSAGFVQRLGLAPTDYHYSGTYVSNGLTIGFLRVPSFNGGTTALTELRSEIDFFQKNTDGLVIDVMRNPGGGCYMLDLAAALTPYPFYFFGEQVRATQDRLNSFQSLLDISRIVGNPQSIDTLQIYVDEMKAALSANRGVTDPIPACAQNASITTAAVMNDNAPGPVVYTKPVIVLIDEFSISAADIFPSMIQDNRRALLVGMRTSGGGGSVSSWPTGFYSESISSNTNTLVVRKTPIATTDYPTAPYVENIGARPDVPLNYMTRDNLVNNGRTFVNQFTQILVDQIRKTPAPSPFTISNLGGVSFTTSGGSGQSAIGYSTIQANTGSTAPSGLAIIGFRRNNILVTEAGVPATPLIQSGRIYTESSGSVNTGIAIANPNSQAATVQFYFTAADGTSGSTGTAIVPANGQIAAFLDQAPFNGVKPLLGTFTFTSSSPVAVVALRSLINERSDPLFTTLPIVAISGTAATGPLILPDFADGAGWTTQIVLINPTDSQLTGTVQFLDTLGNAVTLTAEGQTSNSFNYAIPPRASQRLRTSGTPSAVVGGSVRVIPGGNNISPAGVAIFATRPGGSVTVAEAGVPDSGAATAFRMYAEVFGDFPRGLIGAIQTGLAITNPSSSEVAVTLELRRMDGSATGLTGTLTVPANGQVSKFLYQVPGLASVQLPFQGVLRISSPTPVSVIGLRGRYNERKEFLITTTPPVNEATTTGTALYLPHLADAGGYTTQFILFSGSAGQQSSGTLGFVSQSGATLNLALH